MPRRRKATKREIAPDPKYNNPLVNKFINCLMEGGKRGLAERILYRALDLAQEKGGERGLDIFNKAMNNVKPVLEVKSRRVGGATYQVPVEVRPHRRTALAIRWLISYAKERPGKSMAEKLAAELVAAFRGEGGAIKKKEVTHKMAEANRAFAHYRW